MKTNILLTGSSGFLGQHVLKALSSTYPPHGGTTSCHIRALYYSVEGFEEAVKELSTDGSVQVEIEAEPLDFTREKDVDQWIARLNSGFDACIHTGAISTPRVCQEDAGMANAVNNPKYFFDALYQKNPKMLVIALSTDHVYAGDKKTPYTETDATKPLNNYGKTKVAMEQYLLTKHPESSVILRSSIMLGPKAPLLPEKAHSTFVHFIASRDGTDTVYFTDEIRSVVAVQDVVDSILWFTFAYLKKDGSFVSGYYNMGGPKPLSRMEIAQAVFEYLGNDPKHLIAKKRADQPPGSVPNPLDISMDSSKLQRVTGLSFRSLRDNLKATL